MHELFKNNLFLSKISHIQFFLFISFYFNLFLILFALLSIIFWRISIVFFEGGRRVLYYKILCNFFSEKCQEVKKQRTKQLMICLYFWCDDFIPHTLTYFFPQLSFLISLIVLRQVYCHIFMFCVLFCDFVNKNAWMPIVAGGDKFTTLDKCSPWTVNVVCGLMHLFFCWKSYKEFKCQ